MPHTVDELLKMSNQQLDDLFGASPAGPILDGFGKGTALLAPGLSQAPIAGLVGAIIWEGKTFDKEHGELVNVLASGQKKFPAKVYMGNSLYDGNPCIVLDYSND